MGLKVVKLLRPKVDDVLEGVRKFVLLMDGDFFTNFAGFAGEEMEKPKAQVNLPRLRSLLSVSGAPDSVSASLERLTLLGQLEAIHDWASPLPSSDDSLKGWDGLVLAVDVPYPANLVVDGSRKLGLIFRLLWLSKRCARETRGLWLDLQQVSERREEQSDEALRIDNAAGTYPLRGHDNPA